MTQSQSNVIEFSSLFLLPFEVSDSKPSVDGGGMRPPNIFATRDINAFRLQLLHDTNLIFWHQVQFFCFSNA